MAAKEQEKVAEVLEKVEKGKELTPAEERAYNKAVQEANEVRGYEPFVWSGVTMFRILESPTHTFATEREAQNFVMRSRLRANLTGA